MNRFLLRRIMIISGIRDSLLHPGADDNASGTSAVMELARVFSTSGSGWPSTIEKHLLYARQRRRKGLLGSKYFL